MTLNEFPPEVLAKIFNYLSEHQVKTTSDVNTQWRDIASNWVLVPRGHLLLHHPPDGVRQTPFHTIHIDGNHLLRHHFGQHHLTDVNTVVLYGVWTQQRLAELSQCLQLLPALSTLEISGASPPNFILDFLLIRHGITKIRCFLDLNQSKSFRKVCDRLRRTHGLFEEVIITRKTNEGIQVYIPKTRSVNYPDMNLTSKLTIHPARLSKTDFEKISGFDLKSLTLNYPKNMPANFLTNLSPSLRELTLHNAKTVTHDSWINFFQSPVVSSLERLAISGQNQVDSSIFDKLSRNPNLRKLYLQMHCPCADQCGVKSLLSWCPNIEVLVLYVPYSSVGVDDLVNINKGDVRKLQTLKILFQLTPDMAIPKGLQSVVQIAAQVRERLPRVVVDVEFKTHLREFLYDDEDDFE